METQDIIVFLTAALAFISVVAAGLPLVQRDNLGERLKAVSKRRQELSEQQKQKYQQQRSARFQPKRHVGMMKAVLDRLKLQDMLNSKETRLKLQQAGWRHPSAPVTYIFSRIATPVVLVLVVLLYMSASQKMVDVNFSQRMMILAGAAVVGFYLPAILLKNSIQRRQQVMARQFPDALDLLLICVEAGLSVEAAFSRVTDEMAESAPLIAEELGLTAAELAFLGDRRQAYDNLSDRTGLPAARSLVTGLLQAEKYGTPVSQALRVIAQELRDQRMAFAEKKAAALPAQLTVPMVVFFLPVLFMVIGGPAGIKIAGHL